MKVENATQGRGTRSGADEAPNRVPESEDGQIVRVSVAELAYRIYEERGRQDGHQLDDWLEAERRIAAGGDGITTAAAAGTARRPLRPSAGRPRPPKQRKV